MYCTLDVLYCSTNRLRHLSIDIGHASDEDIAKFYKYVSCLADLQSLEVNTCPDYLRDAHHFIIPFNFNGTGMEFDLAQVTCPLPKLSKLHIPYAHGLDHHTKLQFSLTTLILHFPRVSFSLVQALFQLRKLRVLRIYKPKKIEIWQLQCSMVPLFQGFVEFGFGGDLSVWPLDKHLYIESSEYRSLPIGLVETIVAYNLRIQKASLLYGTDQILSLFQKARCLKELAVAVPFPYFWEWDEGNLSYTVEVLSRFLTQLALVRLCLPCSLNFLNDRANLQIFEHLESKQARFPLESGAEVGSFSYLSIAGIDQKSQKRYVVPRVVRERAVTLD